MVAIGSHRWGVTVSLPCRRQRHLPGAVRSAVGTELACTRNRDERSPIAEERDTVSYPAGSSQSFRAGE